MKPHEERVIEERNQLSDRLDKLTRFIGSPTYNQLAPMHRELLDVQSYLMHSLNWVLSKRINRFAVTEAADVETASSAPAGAKGSEGAERG